MHADMNGVIQEMMNQFYQTNHSMLTEKSMTKRKPTTDKVDFYALVTYIKSLWT
jgi:hypothetical protein